jgi:hypothetical protein
MAAGATIKRYELLVNDYDVAEFLDRVTPDTFDKCWNWQGAKNSEGYGFIKRKKKNKPYTIFTHRLMYTIHNGEIPEGYVVDHMCHSSNTEACDGGACSHRSCINPAHLQAVTFKMNLQMSKRWRGGIFPESSRKNRREKRGTCRKGHPWIEENMIQRKSGRVDCAACRKIHNAKINAKAGA